ncbi:hypothetical protein HC766_03400 [Candidatus Gracilibacteria bacterium]|nr:hypothetical protein [Candidatus Gracilibacteria bacterium]
MITEKIKNFLSVCLIKIKNLSTGFLRFDEYQRLSVVFLIISLLFASISFYPFSKVFSGDWKVNQQVSLILWEPEVSQSNTIFNGILSIRFYSVCLLLAVFCGYFLALYLAKNIILFRL